MEHIYPAFERGRIMKKELLWALRDYSYSALQLQYADYPDDIISGCGIHIEDDFLCVKPGIIKCQDFIFMITEEEKVEYSSTESLRESMNYLSLSILERASMESKNNFETALYIVGKQNPYGITRLALKRGKRFNSVDELSKNELIK